MIGKMIKVDRSTTIYDKGGFARICVEIDLKKPLLPTYIVFGEERPIIYEGLHHVCFSCGKYGHKKEGCPTTEMQPSPQVQEPRQDGGDIGKCGDTKNSKEPSPSKMEVEGMDKRDNVGVREKTKSTGERDNTQKELKTVITGGASGTTGGEASEESPFGKIRILRREIRGHSSSGSIRKELIGNQLPTVGIKEGEEKRNSRKLLPRKDTQTELTDQKISTSSRPIVGNSSCNVDSSHLGHNDVIGLEAGCNLGHSNEGGVLMEDSSTMHGKLVIQVPNSDEHMCDEDNTLGEVATPHHPPTVSQ
ncbi:hypothetical protein K1719_002320 [Acacia pycnantha]|nr:hypothetical protein K1719_002320 [Acacia pycnantha]